MSQLRTTTDPIQPGRRRVALVDDHEVIAAAVRGAMWHAPQLALVTAAPTVDALLARGVGTLDLVVLDLRLQDGSSPQRNVNRLISAGYPVVAFTSGKDAHLLRAAAAPRYSGSSARANPSASSPRPLSAPRTVLP